MKITKKYLKKIIEEELAKTLEEASFADMEDKPQRRAPYASSLSGYRSAVGGSLSSQPADVSQKDLKAMMGLVSLNMKEDRNLSLPRAIQLAVSMVLGGENQPAEIALQEFIDAQPGGREEFLNFIQQSHDSGM